MSSSPSFGFPGPHPLAAASDLAPKRALYTAKWITELKHRIAQGFVDKKLHITHVYDPHSIETDTLQAVIADLTRTGYIVSLDTIETRVFHPREAEESIVTQSVIRVCYA